MRHPSLPEADWRHEPGLQRLLAALADDLGGPLAVGGAVRDGLLGEVVTDVDLATPLHPKVVVERLEAAGIKAVPTGIAHGTITAVADGKPYEVTTLRRDVATDGRRATVAFADSWREDAERRDFTINALYAHPTSGEIFDFFGGLDDLNARRIRFIGNADQRIAEDHLRILRYFRFFARFGQQEPDAEALAACARAANSLTALSRERISQELIKTLSVKNPVVAVRLMLRHGIFAPFIPEVRPDADDVLQRLIDREIEHDVRPSVQARMLAILPSDAMLVDKVAARLKLSNKMREHLAARLKAETPTPVNIRAIAYRGSIDCARDVAMLFASDADLPLCLAALDGWRVPEFRMKGGELIHRGLSAGPVVAKTLQAIESQWIAEGFPEEVRLNEIADQAASAALDETRKS